MENKDDNVQISMDDLCLIIGRQVVNIELMNKRLALKDEKIQSLLDREKVTAES